MIAESLRHVIVYIGGDHKTVRVRARVNLQICCVECLSNISCRGGTLTPV